MLSALGLMSPVAWMYMRTKPKLRYDPSLVQTVIVLPVVISGVVLIVRDSVPLAFSLAGIVAAVRFRNTLHDTKDAVYIFLAIAVGLAAGVQSFAVGFVVSLIYVVVVLVLWRFDIGTAPTPERVQAAAASGQLVAHPPAAGFRVSAVQTTYFRDVYYDTPDGELRQRGGRYRMRFTADGKQHLTVWFPDGTRLDTPGTDAEVIAARLRALVDPATVAPWIERDVARRWRTIGVPLVRLPLCTFVGDTITVRRGELRTAVHELSIRPRPWGAAVARTMARRCEAAPLQLHAVGEEPLQRAQAALSAAEAQILARELRGERELALIAVEHGRLGLCRLGAELRVPVDRGSGEADCRAALRRIVGSGEGLLRLLGVVPPAGDRAALEVWTARRVRGNSPLQWFAPTELLERVGSPVLRDAATLAALTVAARSPLIPEWSGAAFGAAAEDDVAPEEIARASRVTLSEMRTPVLSPDQLDPARAAPEQFLNPELSWVEFNARVLALAEDARIPPAARVRFLGIFSTNLDDFVATKIGALKQLAALKRGGPSADQLRPQEILDAIAIRLRPLIARQYRLVDALLRNRSAGRR